MRELPIATELAGVNMRLKPGGVRELHWHKEAEPVVVASAPAHRELEATRAHGDD